MIFLGQRSTRDETITDAWTGTSQLDFPAAAGEELHDLAPARTGAGFRYELSYTVTDLRTPAVNTVAGTIVAHLKASGVRRDGEHGAARYLPKMS